MRSTPATAAPAPASSTSSSTTAGRTGLAVLMGGGRKWFLPAGTPGSERAEANDYAFASGDAHTAEIVRRWGAAPGALDKGRDLIRDFQSAGFQYAATKTELDAAAGAERLLGPVRLLEHERGAGQDRRAPQHQARPGRRQRRRRLRLPRPADARRDGGARAGRAEEAAPGLRADDRGRLDRQAGAQHGHRALDAGHDRVRPRGARRPGLRRRAGRHAGDRHRRPRMLGRGADRRFAAQRREAGRGARPEGRRQSARQGRRHLREGRLPALPHRRRRLSGSDRHRLPPAGGLRRQCGPLRGLAQQADAAQRLAAAAGQADAAELVSGQRARARRRAGRVPWSPARCPARPRCTRPRTSRCRPSAQGRWPSPA